MNDTRPEASNLNDLHHIHNELSPILENIEVLIDLCHDCEGDSPVARRRASVLHTMLESESAQLRSRLDDLCRAYRSKEVQP